MSHASVRTSSFALRWMTHAPKYLSHTKLGRRRWQPFVLILGQSSEANVATIEIDQDTICPRDGGSSVNERHRAWTYINGDYDEWKWPSCWLVKCQFVWSPLIVRNRSELESRRPTEAARVSDSRKHILKHLYESLRWRMVAVLFVWKI